MVLPQTDTIQEVEIDYITTTTVVRRVDTGLAAFGGFLVGEQVESGEERRPWKFSGYRGLTAGHVAYGVRQDGEILRLSNCVAAMYWQQAVSLSSNVSRIDLQVTVTPEAGPTVTLTKHHKQLIHASRRQGRPMRFQAWYGPQGCESLSIGSRASDFYMRIYDKFAESGLDHYRGALRYELELKRKPALFRALQLDADKHWRYQLATEVHSFAHVRRLQLGWNPNLLSFASVSTFQRWPGLRRLSGTLSKRILYAGVINKRLVQECVRTERLNEFLEATGLMDHVVQIPRLKTQANSLTSEEVH